MTTFLRRFPPSSPSSSLFIAGTGFFASASVAVSSTSPVSSLLPFCFGRTLSTVAHCHRLPFQSHCISKHKVSSSTIFTERRLINLFNKPSRRDRFYSTRTTDRAHIAATVNASGLSYRTNTTVAAAATATVEMSTNEQAGQCSLEQIREELRKFDVDCNGCLQLKLDNETGVATLCINSPQRKNAFSGFMMAQFGDILTQLENWNEGRALVIYGADGFFCSGADLKTVQNLSDKCGAYYISTLMHHNLTRLQRLPLVSVAMVEGKALGGGAEVVTACDFRVFTHTAQIGFVHARLGVTPGFGGGVRLIQLLGATRALQLMLSARPITVQAAQELGLVQHILDEGVGGDEAVRATIDWYMKNYGSITPFASHSIKKIVATSTRNIPLDDALQYEANVFCTVWGSEEHKKALASKIKHN